MTLSGNLSANDMSGQTVLTAEDVDIVFMATISHKLLSSLARLCLPFIHNSSAAAVGETGVAQAGGWEGRPAASSSMSPGGGKLAHLPTSLLAKPGLQLRQSMGQTKREEEEGLGAATGSERQASERGLRSGLACGASRRRRLPSR